MSSIKALTSKAENILIGGKPYIARRLGLPEVYDIIERYVLDLELHEIKECASLLSGQEKIDFILQAKSKLPSGLELQKKVKELLPNLDAHRDCVIRVLLASLDGMGDVTFNHVKAIVYSGDVPEEDVTHLMNVALSLDLSEGSSDSKKKSDPPPAPMNQEISSFELGPTNFP